MNELEEIRLLIKESAQAIDFREKEARIRELLSLIESDVSILDVQKRPALMGAEAALERISKRFHSGEDLDKYLNENKNVIKEFSRKDLENISTWFFRVAYSGGEISAEALNIIRSIVETLQGDKVKNTNKLRSDFERYTLFLKLDFDTNLSRNNLKGLLYSLDVLPLSPEFAQEMRQKVNNALVYSYSPEIDIPAEERIPHLVTSCKSLIEKAEKDDINLGQNESFVLHPCLEKLGDYLESNETINGEVLLSQIKSLKTSFFKRRYRSSTVVFMELKSQLEFIEAELETSIDFRGLSNQLNIIKTNINIGIKGVEGENHLSNYHIKELNSVLDRVAKEIKVKQESIDVLSEKMNEIITEVDELDVENVKTRSIMRIQNYFKESSLLREWINSCKSNKKIEDIYIQRNYILSKCQTLWEKALKNEQEQAIKFCDNCDAIVSSFNSENYPLLPEKWNEIRELEKSVSGYNLTYQKDLKPIIHKTKKKYYTWINNNDELMKEIDSISKQIDGHHRKIYSYVDFEDLQNRANLVQWWASHQTNINRNRTLNKAKRLFAEIEKLKWRQEKVRREKSDQILANLETALNNTLIEAKQNSGNPRVWESLIDIKRQILRIQYDPNQKVIQLMEKVQKGFDYVHEKRAQFAAQSSIIFASYNDELNNILFKLESDASRDAAFEAIEKVKPIRADLQSEDRLLKAHRTELYSMLGNVSQTIDGLFEKENERAKIAFNSILTSIDKIYEELKKVSDYNKLRKLVDEYKGLQSKINLENLPLPLKKELKFRMERLWSSKEDDQCLIKKMRTINKSDRFIGENLKGLISQLEQDNYLIFIDNYPRIS